MLQRTQHLSPETPSVARARRLVVGALAEAGREDQRETAALLVSQLVTNAVLDAGTPIEMTARLRHLAAGQQIFRATLEAPWPK